MNWQAWVCQSPCARSQGLPYTLQSIQNHLPATAQGCQTQSQGPSLPSSPGTTWAFQVGCAMLAAWPHLLPWAARFLHSGGGRPGPSNPGTASGPLASAQLPVVSVLGLTSAWGQAGAALRGLRSGAPSSPGWSSPGPQPRSAGGAPAASARPCQRSPPTASPQGAIAGLCHCQATLR